MTAWIALGCALAIANHGLRRVSILALLPEKGALVATLALPASVLGPVDLNHGLLFLNHTRRSLGSRSLMWRLRFDIFNP
jgi:hypothetical protein